MKNSKNYSLKTTVHEQLLREICVDTADAGMERVAIGRGGLTAEGAAERLVQNALNVLSADKLRHMRATKQSGTNAEAHV